MGESPPPNPPPPAHPQWGVDMPSGRWCAMGPPAPNRCTPTSGMMHTTEIRGLCHIDDTEPTHLRVWLCLSATCRPGPWVPTRTVGPWRHGRIAPMAASWMGVRARLGGWVSDLTMPVGRVPVGRALPCVSTRGGGDSIRSQPFARCKGTEEAPWMFRDRNEAGI